MSERATAILVLGMHRSGTSAVTRALNLCGVDLGARLMPAADGNNERGFWEHLEAVDIHERLLKALGRNWSDPRRLPDGWSESSAAIEAQGRIRDLVRRDFGQSNLWAIKDPRLCRFVPLWIQALAECDVDVKLLFVLRHPAEIAASLGRRDGISEAEARLLMLHHFFEAADASGGCGRSVITYQSLLEDWRACIGRVATELHLKYPSALDDVASQIDAFLDHGERHHHADEGAVDADASLTAQIYRAAASSPSPQEFWSAIERMRPCRDAIDADLMPFVDEATSMLGALDTLDNAKGTLRVFETDEDGEFVSSLVRLQFRKTSALQEGIGKLGQASADLGAMIQLDNEAVNRVGTDLEQMREHFLANFRSTEGVLAELRSTLERFDNMLSGHNERLTVIERRSDESAIAHQGNTQRLEGIGASVRAVAQASVQQVADVSAQVQGIEGAVRAIAQAVENQDRHDELLRQIAEVSAQVGAVTDRIQARDDARLSRRVRRFFSRRPIG